jgi:tetratricopeptide (TPR) repeat protein
VVGSLFVALAPAARGQITFDLARESVTSPPVAVCLAGSFNGWSTSATAMLPEGKGWRATVPLPDGRHYYRFVLFDAKGSHRLVNDPANPFQAAGDALGVRSLIDVRGGVRVQNTEGLERFELRPRKATWVFVAGDFNDWHKYQIPLVPQAGGTWVAYLLTQRPFSYKYIVDGLWTANREGNYQQIPDNCGGLNLFRPAAEVTSPALATIGHLVKAGDTHELDWVSSYARLADYGRAVAMARKIAEVNAAAAGSTAPLVLEAVALESTIHKRWVRFDDAVACWKRLADCGVKSSTTSRAASELAAYYLFVKNDTDEGRRLTEKAAALAPNNAELLNAALRDIMPLFRENRQREALVMMDRLIADLPPAQPKDKKYQRALGWLWLTKGSAHNWLGQIDEAREAFEKVLEVNPYGGSQNTGALQWLDRRGFLADKKAK